MSRDLSVPKCMGRWRIQWNKVYWSPKQYHFSRCTYPGPFLWITLRRTFIPWRRLFPVVIQTENNINNLKILLPSISRHLNNFFWTICHQDQFSSSFTWYYVVLILILWMKSYGVTIQMKPLPSELLSHGTIFLVKSSCVAIPKYFCMSQLILLVYISQSFEQRKSFALGKIYHCKF